MLLGNLRVSLHQSLGLMADCYSQKNKNMARLILMYEMQSAAVKTAPWCGYLIGFTLLMQKNVWVEDDGSMLTKGLSLIARVHVHSHLMKFTPKALIRRLSLFPLSFISPKLFQSRTFQVDLIIVLDRRRDVLHCTVWC